MAKALVLLYVPMGPASLITLVPLSAVRLEVLRASALFAAAVYLFSLISASPLDAVAPVLTLFKNLLALGLFFRLLEPGEVAWALGKIGVRGPAAHLVVLSMRASDVLSREMRSFIAAQRAKGVSGVAALLRSATPLVVYALDYAEYLSVQLRQRSFKCVAARPIAFTKWDVLIIAAVAASLVLPLH
mgnify:FL=1